jgi:hypothetical protein
MGYGGGLDARLPDWAWRVGGRVGRSIASTIIGGAMLAFIGLLLQEHLQGPVASLGDSLVWAGGAAWLFGCLWFVWHCRARPGWLWMLIRVNVAGVAAVWMLMRFNSETTPDQVRQFALAAAQYLPAWAMPHDPLETSAGLFKGLVVLIFGWQAAALSSYCRSVGRPA